MIVNGAPSNTAAYRVEGLDNTNHTVNYALAGKPAQRRCHSGSGGADQQLCAGVRSGRRRSLQHHDEVRHQSVSRQRLRVLRERRSERGVPVHQSTAAATRFAPATAATTSAEPSAVPVRIPESLQRHEQNFFFFSYEEFREASGLNSSRHAADSAYRAGDFSAISPNGGANFNKSSAFPLRRSAPTRSALRSLPTRFTIQLPRTANSAHSRSRTT